MSLETTKKETSSGSSLLPVTANNEQTQKDELGTHQTRTGDAQLSGPSNDRSSTCLCCSVHYTTLLP